MHGFAPTSITVTGRSIYECRSCGDRAFGDTRTIRYQHTAVANFSLEDIKPESAFMPIGWARLSSGFVCPNCLKKNERIYARKG